jgi:hypothetical protein
VSSDAERFFDKTFVSPGKSVAERQTKKERGCPDDCGLCPNHKQHMCSSIIEITGHCDLRCPVCYFGQFDSPHISLEEFGGRVETLLRTENGHLDVLQLSGGEPTLHPRFVEILADACSRDISRVLLNTNGLSLLRDESVYHAVKRQKDRVEVYLQFDGFNREANARLRGRDLLEEKLALVTKLNEDEIKICLAATMVQENLTEVGAILDFACQTRNVTGVTFQRFARTGNGASLATEAILAEEVLIGIAATRLLDYAHVVPLPCSHENCTSISFLFVADGRSYPLADFIDFAKHQNMVQNKIGFEAAILESLREILECGPGTCCSWITSKLPAVRKLKEFALGKGSNHKDMKMLRIVVKNFMDAQTFDAERAEKCCFGVSVGGGRIIPFCVNNIFHRGAHGTV